MRRSDMGGMKHSPSGNTGYNKGIEEENSYNMLHPGSSAPHIPSLSWSHSLCGHVGLDKESAHYHESNAYFTKLCQSTPVGSSNTRTNTVTSATSFSIVGRVWPSCMLKSLRSSLKRVKPQSHSSIMNRRWASIEH